MGRTTWEGLSRPRALDVHVQVKDATLVLTDRAGQPSTCSKAPTVQTKGRLLALGALGGLPTRQRAAGFGFQTRTSSDDSRHAVRPGAPHDLWPQRPGPPTRSQRPKAVEALLIRTRCATDGQREAMAEAFTALGCPVSARRVGRVLADSGRAQTTG
jgi:hypothetical protein